MIAPPSLPGEEADVRIWMAALGLPTERFDIDEAWPSVAGMMQVVEALARLVARWCGTTPPARAD